MIQPSGSVPLPAGVSLGAGQHWLIWADGQPAQSDSGAPHASFRLSQTNGVVALSRMQQGAPAVIDYVKYAVGLPDHSFGSLPDGEPRKRRLMLIPTPAAVNNPSSPTIPVFINEWMSSNRSVLADRADGQFDDWLELFNASSAPVDLSGYYLTTSPTNSLDFRIPDGTVLRPNGFLLFWADGDPAQDALGTDLHANFRLSKTAAKSRSMAWTARWSIASVTGLKTLMSVKAAFPTAPSRPLSRLRRQRPSFRTRGKRPTDRPSSA